MERKWVFKINLNRLLLQSYCMLLLFLPVAIEKVTAIYTTVTPEKNWYKYFSYNFSFLAIPLIFIGIVKRRKTQSIGFYKVILCSFIFNIGYAMFSADNIFAGGHYEMFLIMLQAYAINAIVFSFDEKGKIERAEKFFDTYFIIAMLTMFLRLVLGMSTSGRFGAIGLSVGGTGFLCAIYILYNLYCREYTTRNTILSFVSAVALVLSGQRTSLFMLMIFLVPLLLRLILEMIQNKQVTRKEANKYYFIIVLGIIALLGLSVLLLISQFVKIEGLEFIQRTIDAVVNILSGESKETSSVSGRILSVEAGWKVLMQNPLGISNDIYDLQYRVLEYGYPTYPHSTVLASMLLWSTPITLACVIYLFKVWRGLIRSKQQMHWIILYIIVMGIIWGGPFLDFPLLCIELFFITLASIKCNNRDLCG